jgi:catechol 2,3-dioxygenase-like lactoylglutathione lyase family enzyme
MLPSAKLMAFIATTNRATAKSFYSSVLGLKFVSEDDFAIVFDSSGTLLRIATVEHLSPAPFTVLGWQVTDIVPTVDRLASAGVRFERYSFLNQDERAIWKAPSGASVAWFKDPDGNLLSVSQH